MDPQEEEIRDEEIEGFLQSIKLRSIYDFTNYSMKSMKRRIVKILSESKLSILQLEVEIFSNPQLMEKLVKKITVNTTELFRDPEVWVGIKDEILPFFANNTKINIWHAGCSTGQEIYSMMIILEEMGLLSKSDIYASDINSDVMEIAKLGKYKYRFNQTYIENFDTVLNGGKNPSPTKNLISSNKYFQVDKLRDSIQMKPFLTEKPIYQKIDLVKDENLFNIEFDIIICRNVIIYFNYDLQNKVFNLFNNNLVKNGCLVLGLHESILGPYTSLFEKKNLFYFKKDIYK